jgi:hypothetical protein
MTIVYENDPSTIAAAWVSSPLGDPTDRPAELWETVGDADAEPVVKQITIARHAALVWP